MSPLAPSERALRYVEGLAAKKIPAPENIILAADKWKQLHKEFSYDAGNVDGRCELIEKLDLPSGERAKFELMDYQCFILSFIYGFTDEDGDRAVKKLLLEIPRKSGKTSLLSGVLIGEVVKPMGGTNNPEIIAAGVNEETAGHAFNKARQMLAQDRHRGGGLVDMFGITATSKEIHCEVSGGVIKKVSAGARTLDGFTASVVSFDEISQIPDPSAVDKLYSGLGHDPNHLLLMASTQGELPTSALDIEREVCINLLSSKQHKKVSYIGLLYSAGIDEDWKKQATWEKVQPRLHSAPSMLKFYRQACAEALEDEHKRETFLLRQLCCPLGRGIAWLTKDEFDRMPKLDAKVWPPPEHRKQKHYLGMDLADSHDSTVLSLVSINQDETWEARFWVFYADGKGEFTGNDGYNIGILKSSATNKKYLRWAVKGHALVNSGPIVSHVAVAEQIKEIDAAVRLTGIFTDVYHAKEEVMDHLPEELANRILTINKSSAAQSPVLRMAEIKIKKNLIRVSDNPIVREQFLNACTKHFENGGMLLTKVTKTSPHHIDAADAFIHALIGRSYIASNEKFIGTPIRPIDNEGDGEDDYKVEEYVLE